jgi:hypothetical protein
MAKVKYVVTSKFAHFKVGQVIELDEVCPAGAHAHVKRHVEAKPKRKAATKKADK